MGTTSILYIVIAAYLVLMVVLGWLGRRSNSNISEMTVGRRNAGAWMSAFSYGTAYFSAVMFIGYAGATGWSYGLWGVLPGIGNAVFGSWLAWRVLARRTRTVTRRLGIRSMPQFFEQRFGSKAIKQFCVAVIFLFLIPYSASVYKGLTSVCTVLLGVDERICMIVIALAAAAVIILGGYMAALRADFLQGIVMLGGVLALIFCVVRSRQVGGWQAGIQAIAQKTKDLNLGAAQHIALWATVLMTSFGTWGLPQMVHKYYGIKDDAQIRRGTVISTVFACVVAVGGYFIGSLSRLFFAELPAEGQDYLVPNLLKMAGMPDVLLGVVLVLLISASVSTLASITLTASTTLTMDLVQDRIWKKLSAKGAAVFNRVVVLAFIVLSYWIANSDTPILDMMSYSWGIISGSFMGPYLLSLYDKKLNRAGAWAGMIGGFVIALPPLVCRLFFPDAALPFFGKVAGMGAHFACLAMVFSPLLCLLVSRLCKRSAVGNETFYQQTVLSMPDPTGADQSV